MTGLGLRFLAASILASGGIHLWQYLDGYDAFPVVGPLFLANAVSSVLIAALLYLRGKLPSIVLGIAFAAGSLGALVAAKTIGFFGISAELPLLETEVASFASEALALAALIALVVLRYTPVDEPPGIGHRHPA